jgi:hypothetical protein
MDDREFGELTKFDSRSSDNGLSRVGAMTDLWKKDKHRSGLR